MLGFDWNDGGINNQKLALLGLVILGYEQAKPIYLPRIYSKDQRDTRSSLHAFEEVFDGSAFSSFLDRWSISTIPAPSRDYADRIERAGWKFFDAGAWHLSPASQGKTKQIIADFFRSLVPLITRSSQFVEVCTSIFEEVGVETVTQLRIEEDWRIHCQYNLDPVLLQPEDYNISAAAIVGKVRDTLGVGKTLVSCDEPYIHMAKSDLTHEVYEATGVKIYWKSDFLDPEAFAALRPVDASLFDFEMTKLARTFVGMSRSTFANLATYERACRHFQDRGEDYIYNLPSSRLGKRSDMGRYVDPFEVCGIRRS
jgi:hypothetical protein